MLKIDDVKFKAISYIGSTTNETWIFATKPILENGQYVMPRDYENKSIMNVERINGCILPIMLGDPHTDKHLEVDTTGIYKVTIEKIEEVESKRPMDNIKQPLVMINKVINDLCVIYKFDINWGSGRSLNNKNSGEEREYYLDDYVLYNGMLSEEQMQIVNDIIERV